MFRPFPSYFTKKYYEDLIYDVVFFAKIVTGFQLLAIFLQKAPS